MKFFSKTFLLALTFVLATNSTILTAASERSEACDTPACSVKNLIERLLPYAGVVAFYTYVFNDKKEATKDNTWFNTYITPAVQNEITKALILSIFVDLIKQDSKALKSFFVDAYNGIAA